MVQVDELSRQWRERLEEAMNWSDRGGVVILVLHPGINIKKHCCESRAAIRSFRYDGIVCLGYRWGLRDRENHRGIDDRGNHRIGRSVGLCPLINLKD